MQPSNLQRIEIEQVVSQALQEDIGDGDLTAALIPSNALLASTIVTRDAMTMAGRPWVTEVCRQLGGDIEIDWSFDDGEAVKAGETVCRWRGPARAVLTAERTALNFLQLLSATATATAAYVREVSGTKCKILDTRKTIPGLRQAQKYAVVCGGGLNHRLGLFDAILIKENHVSAAGGISSAVASARRLHPDFPIEVEVESIAEFREALSVQADQIMLDNFSISLLHEAVAINLNEGRPPAKIEASGGLTIDEIASVAATGVDYISVGALTKNIHAIDLSMRFD